MSLLEDLPQHLIIKEAKTWEPGYAAKAALSPGAMRNGGARGIKRLLRGSLHRLATLALQPDPQILWVPDALRQGRRLLEETRHAAIVASGPPFSTFLVGAALSRHYGLPLVLDYRDEWSISNAYMENKRPDLLSRTLQSWMQTSVVTTARALVATTNSSARALETVCKRARSEARVTWIYNGFDPEDFADVSEHSHKTTDSGVYRLAYVGTLWNLTSVEPLVCGVEKLAARNPNAAARLELVFAGRRTPQQSHLLSRLKDLPCRVVEHPYLDHHKALELVRSADGLCVLLTDVPAAARVVPAKIFEYMAARRPILAISPKGELWELLAEYPAKCLAAPTDTDAIADYLESELNRHARGPAPRFENWNPSQHARPQQAEQLAELLNSLG
ncbi:MAG: mshA 2 [Phycisphaerales bacterium]|nr:mshA 2 [Phycisphaerales bacterium]